MSFYDRVGFAAVGRFNEFDNLRRGGIQFADTRGYAYDRRDVTGRQLANVYAQTLGTIFTEQAKPYEVELCVAEVAHYGETKPPELYRITYDGSIADEPHFVVMGGTTSRSSPRSRTPTPRTPTWPTRCTSRSTPCRRAALTGPGNEQTALEVSNLEVAILDTNRPRRAFRRITGAALERLVPENGTALSRQATRRRNRRNRVCPMLIGLLLALGCSVCYGTATVLQAAATRSVDSGSSESGVDAALLLRRVAAMPASWRASGSTGWGCCCRWRR